MDYEELLAKWTIELVSVLASDWKTSADKMDVYRWLDAISVAENEDIHQLARDYMEDLAISEQF